jgi:hypothetical protein
MDKPLFAEIVHDNRCGSARREGETQRCRYQPTPVATTTPTEESRDRSPSPEK